VQQSTDIAVPEIGARHREQAAAIGVGVVDQLLSEKEEGLVASVVDLWQIDRRAERKSAFIVPDDAAGALKKRSRVQGVVIEIIVDAAVKRIGARANRDVGEPASGPAVFGIEGIHDHAELADLFDCWSILL